MQILPASDPDSSTLCSEAFERRLEIAGLAAAELASLFGADRTRRDELALASRGPISVRIEQDEGTASAAVAPKSLQPERLPDGQALLASGLPGQARLQADAATDRLLPGPLNLLLAQQWARQGLFPLHAAALRWRGRGVMILGGRGAGKSSLVLAALAEGAEVVSDDWLLVGCERGEVRAERLRQFLMLRPGETWTRFAPSLGGDLDFRCGNDGRFVHAISPKDPAFPSWIRVERCLLLHRPPADRPATTRLEASDQAGLLGELIDAAMPVLMTHRFPVERALLFDRFNALIRRLPTAAVTTGRDLLADPRSVLERLISD